MQRGDAEKNGFAPSPPRHKDHKEKPDSFLCALCVLVKLAQDPALNSLLCLLAANKAACPVGVSPIAVDWLFDRVVMFDVSVR